MILILLSGRSITNSSNLNKSAVDESVALFNAYIALVVALHEKGVLNIDEVVKQFGDLIDSSRMQHLDAPNTEYQTLYYEALRKVATSLAQSGKQR